MERQVVTQLWIQILHFVRDDRNWSNPMDVMLSGSEASRILRYFGFA